MEDSIPATASGRSKKLVVRRRSWTRKEEEVLLQELHVLVSKGWKSDNGFRPGYLQQLEAGMVRAFPNTDIKGEPHINSKITVWKRQHGTLITLLSKSGIQWNDKDKMISITLDDVYEQHCKVDKEARKMRFKSFPFLEDWNLIFGKDRATGEQAEDIEEAVKHTRDVHDALKMIEVDIRDVPLVNEIEDDEDEEIDRASVNQPKRKGKKKVNDSKRSKLNDVDLHQNMVEILRQFSESTTSKLDCLVKTMSYELELSKKRDEIFAELGKMEWLGLEDRIIVSNYFSNNNNALQLIFTLPPEARESMVKLIIQGKI